MRRPGGVGQPEPIRCARIEPVPIGRDVEVESQRALGNRVRVTVAGVQLRVLVVVQPDDEFVVEEIEPEADVLALAGLVCERVQEQIDRRW